MMEIIEQQALRIARDALDTDPDQRNEFVSLRCQDNPELHARVQVLLESMDAIAVSELSNVSQADPADPLLGQRLGPFRVVERVGRGGMGIVYRGEREDADFRQTVALKLIRRGFDFDDVQSRFLRERRILAQLSHPNLARFVDGGVSADGRPWFALEFVQGQSISRWCDQRRLDIRARLRLFLEVCAAVQYAHTQLVVHRDLKPGNILIDDSGTVSLLDFGIARLLTGDGEPDATLTTIGGCRALTPEYAAPEQLGGEATGVASDVYSLGVIAYELISGVLPYDVDRHDSFAALLTAREFPARSLTQAIAREAGPLAPHAGRNQSVSSEKGGPALVPPTFHAPAQDNEAQHEARAVSEGEGDLSPVQQRLKNRRTTLRGYRSLVRGDLSRILDTALSKEPGRRYATVAALADDLQRWLSGSPVRVSGNRLGYRLRKFVQRNRAGVAMASLSFALVIAGISGVLWQAREALREAERANAVQSFLLSLFENVAPGAAAGTVPDTRSLLERGVERAQIELRGQPRLQADMLTTLGRIHNQLGLYQQAEPLLQQALTVSAGRHGDSLRRADILLDLGRVARAQQRYDDALPLLHEALALVVGRDPTREADTRNLLGVVLALSGKVDEGVGELNAALTLLQENEPQPGRKAASTLNDLGFALEADRRYEEALQAYRASLAVARQLHGDVHVSNGQSLSNIGNTLRSLGRLDEAETALREAVEIDEQVYIVPHRSHAIHIANLALVVLAKGDAAEAVRLLRESKRIRAAVYGDDHAEVARTIVNLSAALISEDLFEEAVAELSQAIAIFTVADGDWRSALAFAQQNLARALRGLQRWDEAEAALYSAIAGFEALQGDRGMQTLHAHAALGNLYLESGRHVEAHDILERTLQTSLAELPPGHPHLPQRHLELADAKYALGRYEDARSHYENCLRLGLAAAGERNRNMIEARLGLVETLTRLGNQAGAMEHYAATRSAIDALPPGHSLHGRALRIAAALPGADLSEPPAESNRQ